MPRGHMSPIVMKRRLTARAKAQPRERGRFVRKESRPEIELVFDTPCPSPMSISETSSEESSTAGEVAEELSTMVTRRVLKQDREIMMYLLKKLFEEPKDRDTLRLLLVMIRRMPGWEYGYTLFVQFYYALRKDMRTGGDDHMDRYDYFFDWLWNIEYDEE